MRYIKRNDITSILSYSGQMMMAIGVMILIPIVVDLIYLEFNCAGYLLAGSLSLICGIIFDKGFRKYRKTMRLKHAMIVSGYGLVLLVELLLVWLLILIIFLVFLKICLL